MSWRWDALTKTIIYCGIRVHGSLGPGYKENIYKQALKVELRLQGLAYDCEKEVLIYYEGFEVGRHVLDLLVADEVVVELKCAESLGGPHYAQVRSYLKATNKETGLLFNFSGDRLDYRRISNSSPISERIY